MQYLSRTSKLMCGVILISIPSIQYGGYFLLQVISGMIPELELTEFQQAMFRAGHAHAGVLILLSLIAQPLADNVNLSSPFEWIARAGIPFSALLVSGGFFAAAIGKGVTSPTEGIYLLYVGVFTLAISVVVLGMGLIRAK